MKYHIFSTQSLVSMRKNSNDIVRKVRSIIFFLLGFRPFIYLCANNIFDGWLDSPQMKRMIQETRKGNIKR